MFPRIVVLASGPRWAGPTYGLILFGSIPLRRPHWHKEFCLFESSNIRSPEFAVGDAPVAPGDRFAGLTRSKGLQGKKGSRARL